MTPALLTQKATDFLSIYIDKKDAEAIANRLAKCALDVILDPQKNANLSDQVIWEIQQQVLRQLLKEGDQSKLNSKILECLNAYISNPNQLEQAIELSQQQVLNHFENDDLDTIDETENIRDHLWNQIDAATSKHKCLVDDVFYYDYRPFDVAHFQYIKNKTKISFEISQQLKTWLNTVNQSDFFYDELCRFLASGNENQFALLFIKPVYEPPLISAQLMEAIHAVKFVFKHLPTELCNLFLASNASQFNSIEKIKALDPHGLLADGTMQKKILAILMNEQTLQLASDYMQLYCSYSISRTRAEADKEMKFEQSKEIEQLNEAEAHALYARPSSPLISFSSFRHASIADIEQGARAMLGDTNFKPPTPFN